MITNGNNFGLLILTANDNPKYSIHGSADGSISLHKYATA